MEGELYANYYKSDKIIVLGNTKRWKENLKALGCRYVAHVPEYENKAGWMCSKSQQESVMQFIADANAGLVQPKAWAPSNTVQATPTAPLVGRDPTVAAMSPEDAVALLRKSQPAQPTQPLPSVPQTLAFPNLFIGADGATYQVAVYVSVVPSGGGVATLTTEEGVTDYIVTGMKNTAPYDKGVITLGATNREIAMVAGQWQVLGLNCEHTLTFHPQQ